MRFRWVTINLRNMEASIAFDHGVNLPPSPILAILWPYQATHQWRK